MALRTIGLSLITCPARLIGRVLHDPVSLNLNTDRTLDEG
jgi:hypothetical protein